MHSDPWTDWSSSIWVHSEYMNSIPKMPKAMMEDSKGNWNYNNQEVTLFS